MGFLEGVMMVFFANKAICKESSYSFINFILTTISRESSYSFINFILMTISRVLFLGELTKPLGDKLRLL
jgi:hypothetical protein